MPRKPKAKPVPKPAVASTSRRKTLPVLGPCVAIYRCRPFSWRDFLLFGLASLLLVAAPLAYGLWLLEVAASNYGPIAAESWTRPWFIISGLSLLILLLYLIYRLLVSRRYVAVYKNGLLLRLSMSKPRAIHWSKMNGIANSVVQNRFLFIQLYTYQSAYLYLTDGTIIYLRNSIQNLPELITRIKASLYPRRLPTLRARFQAGDWLSFGSIAIQHQGIHFMNGNQITLWDQIESINVQGGYLHIVKVGRGNKKLLLARIPNFELMLQLIQEEV